MLPCLFLLARELPDFPFHKIISDYFSIQNKSFYRAGRKYFLEQLDLIFVFSITTVHASREEVDFA
jgi:hypothetical protein